MAQTGDLRPEVKTTQSWEDKIWLNQWPFNKDTVLEYFYNSIFFDRRSTNAQLKMQQPELPPDRAKAALEKMDGITYELMRDEEIPPMNGAPPRTLYVIRMARRRGAEVTVLRWYYVLDGVVFEAPSLQAALSARVQRLGWHLSKAFEGLRAAGLKAKEATSKRASRATSRATSRGSSPPPEAESAELAADDRPRKRRRP